MIHQQQAVVERVNELERMVVRLNGRIGELQRQLKHTKATPFMAWRSGFRLRRLFGGSKQGSTIPGIRENRRVPHHELCLF
jgi:hypothetical protein